MRGEQRGVGRGRQGKQKEALAAATTLVDEALAELLWHSGDLESAIANLTLAVASAERARSDDVRAGRMSVLVAVIGFEQARHNEALQIGELAAALEHGEQAPRRSM